MRTPSPVLGLALGLMLGAACKMKDAEVSEEQAQALSEAHVAAQNAETEAQRLRGAPADKSAAPAAPPKVADEAAPARADRPMPTPVVATDDGKKKPEPKAGDADRPEGKTRAWFPETFLFEPLVVTDDQGAAVVPVRVPDRLTTWRVLALAHSRSGAQGGAVTSFLGTLPTYVDPVVPAFLVQGDQVRVPIQLVNTTARDVAAPLEISAQDAQIVGNVGGGRTIPAQGSTLDYVTLAADHPGPIKLRVALGGTDAVERTIEVRPAGRPVTQTFSGTLAAPRRFSTPGTPGADPTTDRVRLLVFPGALALLRSELAVSTARTGVADDAYALLLAGRAAALLAALGDKPDPAVLRDLAIVTAQRAVRDGRTLDVERATLLAEAALAHPSNPVLARLGERAAAHLAQNQRPDGTFSGATGWTLQRLLVATAEAVRAAAADHATSAARQRALQVQTRAAGAFARTAEQVTDGYTAAAILASGGVSGELADTLRTRVRGAIRRGDDGGKYLDVGEGVVRADGEIPTRIEATALAVLALEGDAQASLADLGTTLLGAYSIARGWGDGRANLVAMQAVLALFKTPLPSAVTVTLEMDGTPILHGTLEGAKLRDVLALEGPTTIAEPGDGGPQRGNDRSLPAGRVPPVGPGLAGAHAWKLAAEPAVPGLGYSLALDSWLPWDKQVLHDGLELASPAHVDATVGKPLDMTISAVAPSGIALHIQQALPAGVQVDAPSLEAHVADGAIERFVAADGTLDLYVPALEPGKTFTLSYRLVPTLGGTLHSGASLIEAGASQLRVPPATWTVR